MFEGNYLDAPYIYRTNVNEALHDAITLGPIAAGKLHALARAEGLSLGVSLGHEATVAYCGRPAGRYT
jgi:hypothetical protein